MHVRSTAPQCYGWLLAQHVLIRAEPSVCYCRITRDCAALVCKPGHTSHALVTTHTHPASCRQEESPSQVPRAPLQSFLSGDAHAAHSHVLPEHGPQNCPAQSMPCACSGCFYGRRGSRGWRARPAAGRARARAQVLRAPRPGEPGMSLGRARLGGLSTRTPVPCRAAQVAPALGPVIVASGESEPPKDRTRTVYKAAYCRMQG